MLGTHKIYSAYPAGYAPYTERCKPLKNHELLNMKSKFIKILITINGILLIPILIFLTYEIVYKELNKSNKNVNDFNQYQPQIIEEQTELKDDYKIQFSSVFKIPNSENYMIASYKYFDKKNSYPETEIILPYTIPTYTFNLTFLDKEFNTIGKLLDKKGSIKSMYIPYEYNRRRKVLEELKYLSFYIATEDTNKDGTINLSDEHHLYVTELNGKNLTQVTDKKLKQYQWINDGEEMILTFETEGKLESDKLKLGIYNVKSKKMRIPRNK